MEDKEIIKIYNEISDNLDNDRMGNALDSLTRLVGAVGTPSQLDRAMSLHDSYGYLVKYLVTGGADPERDNLYSDLSERVRALADDILRHYNSLAGSDLYSSTLRLERIRPESLASAISQYASACAEMSLADPDATPDTDLRSRRELLQERLFNKAMTLAAEENEAQEIVRAIESETVDRAGKVQLLSGLILGLQTYYARDSFAALLDVYENTEDERLAALSLVGIVMTMMRHRLRVAADRRLAARLSLWQDSLVTYRRLRETIRAIIATRDTERISAKMKEEIMPELMKLRPDILKTLRETGGDPEALLDNPEWEEMLNRSGLEKKMQEFTELQSDGADLMMVTFANLKQFPFFNRANNWFLPFDINHSAVTLDNETRHMVSEVMKMGDHICNSDKYSLALGLGVMPAAQKQMATNQFNAQLEQLNEQLRTDAPRTSTPVFDSEVVAVVRDFYRFFKLYRNRQHLPDFFAGSMAFLDLPIIGEMMADDEVLRIVGEFYFKRGFYADALPMLERLTENNPDDATLYEKIGFCHQQLKDFGAARQAYNRAALLHEPGQWLLKKLAFVNKRLGDYAEAARYYTQALDAEPDNVSLLLAAANASLEGNDIPAAIAHLYHANYLAPDDVKVLHTLAWTELLNHNPDKSVKLYSRLLNDKPAPSDKLNAGHANILAGNVGEAARLYAEAASGNKDEFEVAIMSDLPTLIELGADPRTIKIILDNIKFY